jgi:uncharacterized protein
MNTGGLHFKTAPVAVKNADDAGTFEAYVAVYDNVDAHGDVMRYGSFKDTLDEWAEKDAQIPVWWSHQMNDPDMNLGYVLDAKETERGLWVKAQLDLDSPKAVTVHRLLKGGRVREFSFAYEITDGGIVKTKDDEDVFEIRAVKLHEVGPTPIGANSQTELIDVKAAAERLEYHIKAGRVFSARNEAAIRDVIDTLSGATTALKSVLPEDDSADEEDQEPTSGKEPAAEAEKSSAAPTPSPSVALAFSMIRIETEGGAPCLPTMK